jgi:nucleoid DNA-binding protein
MTKLETITAIQGHSPHSRKTITDVLEALSIVVTGELQANEPVSLPFLGKLLPIDVPQGRNKRVREAQFKPNRDLRKQLGAPLRRAKIAAR